jgi:ribonuclease Z
VNEFSVTFLGTAAASVNPRIPTACCLVRAGGTRIIIDAGAGALAQLRRTGVDPADIDTILITHWHIDHFLGLPALLRAKKRTHPLTVLGPEPSSLARFYLSGLLRNAHVSFEVIRAGFAGHSGNINLEAVPTLHDINSFGWAISETGSPQGAGRKLVYSGDTKPAGSILNASRGADLLVHEATFPDGPAGRADAHEHSTPSQAASIALEAGAGALALIHMRSPNAGSGCLSEAEKIFPGIIIPALLDKILIQPVPGAGRHAGAGWGEVRLERAAGG